MAKAKIKTKNKIRVKRVKLPRAGVLQIVAPKDVHPVVVPKQHGLEIIPVKKERAASVSWWRQLFYGE